MLYIFFENKQVWVSNVFFSTLLGILFFLRDIYSLGEDAVRQYA